MNYTTCPPQVVSRVGMSPETKEVVITFSRTERPKSGKYYLEVRVYVGRSVTMTGIADRTMLEGGSDRCTRKSNS